MNEIKDIKDKYKVIVEWSTEDGCFLASVPELKGCQTHGDTQNEAIANAKEAIELYLESLAEDNEQIPMPESLIEYSGQMALRMPKSVHGQLASMAKNHKQSINEFAVSLIVHGISEHPPRDKKIAIHESSGRIKKASAKLAKKRA